MDKTSFHTCSSSYATRFRIFNPYASAVATLRPNPHFTHFCTDNMKTATLKTGRKIPLNGFGTWKADEGAVKPALRAALDAGYRHIDCAAVYCNEKEVGEVFAEYFGGDSPKIAREDVWITSKLWNTCHAPEKVSEAFEQTLADLQLDYLDLYLVHFPFAFEFSGLPITGDNCIPSNEDGLKFGSGVTLQNTWQAMEALVETGKVRDIGVSNYTVAHLCDVLQYARIKPAVNQCEMHVNYSRTELRQVCENFGIHFTAYSTLGSGKTGPLSDPVVCNIAEKLSVSPAQVLIAWALSKNVSLLAKSTKPERITSNLAAEKLSLDGDDIAKLDGLNKNLITCNMEEYWGFPSHC